MADFSCRLPHNAVATDGSCFFGGRVPLVREVLLALEVPLVLQDAMVPKDHLAQLEKREAL